ncbi:MAG: hypothetical protein K2L25_02100 [Alphaproteobacteria bacterium]|nr:hypothetical protein [Alphaproteobacteria bacterium]
MAYTYEISGNNNHIVLFDDMGNEFCIEDDIPGLFLRVGGNNNIIRIHKNTVFNNSSIAIENDNAEIEIQESSHLCILVGIASGYGQKLHIGRETRIGGANFSLAENSQIFIGDNCLLSYDIQFMAADGHSIFDNDTHEFLNKPLPIVIGNHCWIGWRCTISKGAGLADNSVLGMCSVLSRKISTPNVAIAGVPARILRRNINWSSDQLLTLYQRGWCEAVVDKDVVMAFSCSNYYVPYLGVALTSLAEHISRSKNYKIFIMENGLSDKNKSNLMAIAADKPNMSIEFKNVSKLVQNLELPTRGHVSRETFFKLLIPTLFREYRRVMFCDSDILFMSDPAPLFFMDMGDKKIAAGLCHLWNGILNMRSEIAEYASHDLHLTNADAYFQGGILLFNNEQISDDDVAAMMKIAAGKNYHFLDQDVLNMYFQDSCCLFDSAWNYETPQQSFVKSNEFMSPAHLAAYNAAGENPLIIHYSGPDKPWLDTHEDHAGDWWKCARRSLFYEDLQDRRSAYVAKIVYIRTHTGRMHFKCMMYRVARHLCGGDLRKKLRSEYDRLKTLIRHAADFDS